MMPMSLGMMFGRKTQTNLEVERQQSVIRVQNKATSVKKPVQTPIAFETQELNVGKIALNGTG